jgi:hypothetical protein
MHRIRLAVFVPVAVLPMLGRITSAQQPLVAPAEHTPLASNQPLWPDYGGLEAAPCDSPPPLIAIFRQRSRPRRHMTYVLQMPASAYVRGGSLLLHDADYLLYQSVGRFFVLHSDAYDADCSWAP